MPSSSSPLSAADLAQLTAFRRWLHRHPEPSGEESATAGAVVEFLLPSSPDEVVTGLGGHGVAISYVGTSPGPTVLLRAELDALRIHETTDVAYRSERDGIGHHCGHDGHMAVLAGVARVLARRRPERGRVVLLFQPAEESGDGARAVLADPAFAAVSPDLALSMHNLSWLPLGTAGLREGHVNCASRGIRVTLTGMTAHASTPEDGVSPVPAVSTLLRALPGFGAGGALDEDFRLVTVTHARVGEEAFGISPGYAEVWATLRTLTDDRMLALRDDVVRLVTEVAAEHALVATIEEHSVFPHCENAADAVAVLAAAIDAVGMERIPGPVQRASEDFGLFRQAAPSAMYFLGSGRGPGMPQMHNSDFDFPDELIDPAVQVFVRAVRDVLG